MTDKSINKVTYSSDTANNLEYKIGKIVSKKCN